jgi:hypothetical protein
VFSVVHLFLKDKSTTTEAPRKAEKSKEKQRKEKMLGDLSLTG